MCCREGKSTLINELARAEGVFEVRSSTDTCTRGVDISTWCPEWSDFSLAPRGRDSREPQPRMVFADAEGTGCKDGDYDLQVSRQRCQQGGRGTRGACSCKSKQPYAYQSLAQAHAECHCEWRAAAVSPAFRTRGAHGAGGHPHLPLRSSQLGPTLHTWPIALALPSPRTPFCRSWFL
jgi:hypothetical protein